MAVVTTSIVVDFDAAGSDGSILTLEVDSREDGYNKGKSSFSPGNDVYLLLLKTPDVTVQNLISSHGLLTKVEDTTIAVKEFGQFANEKSVSLSRPIPTSAPFTVKWFGNDLGNVAAESNSKLILTATDEVLGDPFVGIMEYEYTAEAEVWKLSNTLISGESTYGIIVYLQGTVP